jgi:hypothetical protein
VASVSQVYDCAHICQVTSDSWERGCIFGGEDPEICFIFAAAIFCECRKRCSNPLLEGCGSSQMAGVMKILKKDPDAMKLIEEIVDSFHQSGATVTAEQYRRFKAVVKRLKKRLAPHFDGLKDFKR